MLFLLGVKKCSRCGEIKVLEEFNRRSTSPDGRQWNCRACNAAWHAEHKAHHNKLIHTRRSRVRAEIRRRLIDYLATHPCVDCGETDPVVLEFDHLRDKRAPVTTLAASYEWATIQREIEKCVVRCANCHRRVTAERARTFRWRYTRADSVG